MSRFKTIELFAGAGGAAIGFENAGFSHVALCEIDKHACQTLRINRPDWNILEDDAANIDWSPYKNAVDVVFGGFPCQAFSYAGNRLGFADPRGTLFFELARCVETVRPFMAIAENVRGITTHDGGRTLETILSHMESIGYVNISRKVHNTAEYGVPQKRERLISIWLRKDIAYLAEEFTLPSASNEVKTLADALKAGGLYPTDVPQSKGSSYSANKAAVMELVPAGGNWRDLPEDIAKSYMKGSWKSGGGKTGIARRLSWDKPSLTILTTPSQMQTERCHPDETRPLTIREAARIQTFPDEWEFSGSVSSQYRQIGNAVPCLFAEKLARQCFAFLKRANLRTRTTDMSIAA